MTDGVDAEEAELLAQTGRTWAQLASEFNTRCGGCQGGMLRVEKVDVDEREDIVALLRHMNDLKQALKAKGERTTQEHWESAPRSFRVVAARVIVRCDQCRRELVMPLPLDKRFEGEAPAS